MNIYLPTSASACNTFLSIKFSELQVSVVVDAGLSETQAPIKNQLKVLLPMIGSALALVYRYAPMRLPFRIPTAGLNGAVFNVALFLRRSMIKECVRHN